MPPPSRPSLLRSLSSYTRKNKPRLYIALYPRGGSASSFTSSVNCDSYHWAIIIGPRTSTRQDPGTRYHVVHASGASLADSRKASATDHALLYEEDDMLISATAQTVLVRVTIAKVLDQDRAATVMRSLPIPDSEDHTFSCLSWVHQAFKTLLSDGCIKSYQEIEDWKDMEACARQYCKRKRDQRRFTNDEGPWDMGNVSTWNFWENRESMP